LTQGAGAVALGGGAGFSGQGSLGVAVGTNAGEVTQGGSAVAIGPGAGRSGQGGSAVAIGSVAGEVTQASGAVAIGLAAGRSGQLGNATSIGRGAGAVSQGVGAVAIGFLTANTSQGGNSVAIGALAGTSNQGASAVAIGYLTANTSQGANSVAIGQQAGTFSLGANSVAIGALAGRSGTLGNTIVLNATGTSLNGTTANAFYVKPVRNVLNGSILQYNTSSGEISYDSNISIAGSIAGNNVSAINSVSGNNISATELVSGNNVSATNGVSGGNISATGDIVGNNFSANGNIQAFGGGSFNCFANGAQVLSLVNNAKSFSNFLRMEAYGTDTAAINMYRTGGDQSAPAAVANGAVIYSFSTSVYGDSGNIFVDTGGFDIRVDTNFGNGTVTTTANYGQGNSGSSGTLNFNYDEINFNGNINYTKTYGQFTSNATQTNSNVGNAVYMTLNNDEGSNGVSIVSSTQITTARTGLYNLQFSAQIEKTDSGTDEVEIWLTKNGTPVANSATRLAQQGNNEKGVAAWNWLVDSANINDYYEIAWASADANMQITAIDSANTLSGVAIPSLIVTVVPVGA
jgi:hypothetical protein